MTVQRSWRLTGLQYLVMRDRLVGRRQNWPFSYISDIRGYYDFEFAKARVWGELQATWDPALAEVLVKSLKADIRMVVHAGDTTVTEGYTGRKVMVGKRFGDRAVLVEGFVGASPESHDEIEITELDAASLAGSIVDRLPPMAAGNQPRVELLSTGRQESFDHWHGRSSYFDEDDDRDVEIRSRMWQAAPKSTVGRIVITQGRSAFGPSGQVTKHIFWEDHPGDGRYVIQLEPPMAAVATDADALRKLIDRHCDELLLVGADESRRGVARDSVYDDGR